MNQNETYVGDEIPDANPMKEREQDENKHFRNLLGAFNSEMRQIISGKVMPRYLRVKRAPSEWPTGAALALLEIDAKGPISNWFFKVSDGKTDGRLHVRSAELWKLRPGDFVDLKDDGRVIVKAINEQFFGPEPSDRIGIEVLSPVDGRSWWKGVDVSGVLPALGVSPAAKWVRTDEGDDSKTEAVGPILDKDKTLAEALAEDRRVKVARMGEEKQVEPKKAPSVTDRMTDGDKAAEGARLGRITILRKEIPVAEKKLMDMKKELRKLTGVD
jgi:hypothetical protein